jgi:hypothetical protein
MEPVFMTLGQSAATAGSIAIDDKVAKSSLYKTKAPAAGSNAAAQFLKRPSLFHPDTCGYSQASISFFPCAVGH